MTELFSQLDRLAVQDGFVKVSNDCGEIAAMYSKGRLTYLSYKTYPKQ